MNLRDASDRPRPVRATVACAMVAALAAVAAVAAAQSGSRLADTAPPAASRWQAEVAQLDDALRSRLLVATAPRANWLAAKLDHGDPENQVRRFASARVAAPDNRLYLAALATACMVPMQPLPAECDAVDRLADWATRDVDNGVPMLLLANRARQRNNATAMVAYLEEAARRPRFDDYWNMGALVIWEEVRALPGPADPAARAELAASYGAAYESPVARATDVPVPRREGGAGGDPRGVRGRGDRGGDTRRHVVAARGGRAPGRARRGRRSGAGRGAAAAGRRAAAVLCDARSAATPSRRRSNRPIRPCARRAVAQWEARLAQDAPRRRSRRVRAGARGRAVPRRAPGSRALAALTSPARSTARSRTPRCASAPSGCRCICRARPAPCCPASRGAAAGSSRRRSTAPSRNAW